MFAEVLIKQPKVLVYQARGGHSTCSILMCEAVEWVSQGWAKWHRTKGRKGIKLKTSLTALEKARTKMPIGQVLSHREKNEDGTPGAWVHSDKCWLWNIGDPQH
jgi:hypothetical protein